MKFFAAAVVFLVGAILGAGQESNRVIFSDASLERFVPVRRCFNVPACDEAGSPPVDLIVMYAHPGDAAANISIDRLGEPGDGVRIELQSLDRTRGCRVGFPIRIEGAGEFQLDFEFRLPSTDSIAVNVRSHHSERTEGSGTISPIITGSGFDFETWSPGSVGAKFKGNDDWIAVSSQVQYAGNENMLWVEFGALAEENASEDSVLAIRSIRLTELGF